MTMGSRIAVMNHGQIQQVAHPFGTVQPPSYPLRRGIHWLTADEFPPVQFHALS